jgi:cytochrome P450
MSSTFQEDLGDGWLAPVRPAPRTAYRGAWEIMLKARQDLLSNWCEADYRAKVQAFRLFRRHLVIVNTVEGVKQVLGPGSDNYERKSPQMRRALEFLLGDGLFISDGATWAQRRPLVAELLGKNRLPGFGAEMAAAAQETAGRWAGLAGGPPVDVLTEMGVLTAEIVSRTIFGVRIDRSLARQVIDGFAEYQRRIDSFNLGYLLGLDEGWPVWKGLALRRATRKVHRVVDKVIGDQLNGRGDHTLMLDLLAIRRQKNPDGPVGRDALRDEAATLFMAGHETTAATLAWTWRLLSLAPWAEQALHEEIASVCGDRAPAFEDVPRLAYARAIVEETLRLYPPVAFLARQAKGRDRIGHVEVEPATVVFVSPWLLHRSPDLWPQPERFMPERFLGPDRPSPFAYVPFAVGPRVCPGMTFGLTEAVLCLATLAQRFRVRPAPGVAVEPQCRLTLRPKGGLPMLIESR